MFGKRREQRVQYGIWNLPWGDREIVQNSKNPHIHVHPRRPKGIQWGREKRRDESFQSWAEEPLGTRTDVLWVKWVNESWVMSHESMSQIWKNKSFGRNNKIKHYFYLICLLASLLPAHARPISDMKSQLGLFVSSIPGPAASSTCMPRKIAFPDTLQEPFKPSDNPYY